MEQTSSGSLPRGILRDVRVRSGNTGSAHVTGVRSVGALEIAKGVFVLLVGFGLVTLEHTQFGVQDVALFLLYVLHINPHRHLSMVFLSAAARLDDVNVMSVAAVAALYSTMRFIEGYGLWCQRAWAEWMAIISGLLYVPLEIYELAHRATPLRWAVFIINVLIVIYMAYLRIEPGVRTRVRETSPAAQLE